MKNIGGGGGALPPLSKSPSMKKKKKHKWGFGALKFDMQKSYD